MKDDQALNADELLSLRRRVDLLEHQVKRLTSGAYCQLKPRFRIFVNAYLKHQCNATAAAREAGYGCPETYGVRVLHRADVQAAIAELSAWDKQQ
jgi:hypothetical protein